MKSGKEFQFGEDARKKVLKGVETLKRCVATTMGPQGNLVLHQRPHGNPYSTKDGVTVAKSVALKDKFENMGAQICRESAEKTNQLCGDGTTGSVVLAKEIVSEGYKLVAAGHKPIHLKRGIDWAVEKVVEILKERSREIKSSKEVAQVGTISANGDTQIGDLLAEALDKVGNGGVITIEEAGGFQTEFLQTVGYQFDRGWLSHYFINNERSECELDNPLILVTTHAISNSAVFLPIMEEVYKKYQGRPLLIIAENVDGEALALLAVNSVKQSLKSCCVKLPGFGDLKKQQTGDIATLVGAQVIDEEAGLKLEKFSTDYLGAAKKVVITRGATTIIEGLGDPENIKKRADLIRAGIGQADNEWDIERQEKRLAKFVGGIGILKIGAASESEMKEKKDRCEDALNATRSATEEGVSPGGGCALLRIGKELDKFTPPEEYKYGVEIVKKSLSAPIKQILFNAGLEPAEVIMKIMENDNQNFGFNAATNKFEDLVESGVIDPTKVIRCALQNAASVAGILLLTETLIVDDQDDSNNPQGM